MWWMSHLQSGGSIEMWHSYFGPGLTMYGIDINPYCKASCSANADSVYSKIGFCTCRSQQSPCLQQLGSIQQHAECALHATAPQPFAGAVAPTAEA